MGFLSFVNKGTEQSQRTRRFSNPFNFANWWCKPKNTWQNSELETSNDVRLKETVMRKISLVTMGSVSYDDPQNRTPPLCYASSMDTLWLYYFLFRWFLSLLFTTKCVNDSIILKSVITENQCRDKHSTKQK